MEPEPVKELKAHSVLVGSNPDLVQASGGNTSWKSGSRVLVKGSGKRLKDACVEEIFSSINFESLTQHQIAECQDFSSFASGSIAPSIEANFHILIENSFVTHLHSLSGISLSVSTEVDFSEILNSGISFVPYCRPGVDLAQAILLTPKHQENILVLGNHGVIFSGASCSQIENKIEKFEKSIKNLFENLKEVQTFPDWIQILVSGVLTPDEAVFLGKIPFVESEAILDNSIAINSSGELLFPQNFSDDRTLLVFDVVSGFRFFRCR
jgi:rhamnose utilization protein RhaD (predicted bifunctional aldolase and dehydrogenase)